jgi:hypothetical protein
MLKGFIEKALEVVMASHLTETSEKNKRNGKGKKTLKATIGEIDISHRSTGILVLSRVL